MRRLSPISSDTILSGIALFLPNESRGWRAPWRFCMVTVAFLLAAFLDPVQAALVLAVLLLYRGPQPILVAAAAAAVASETVIMLAAADYMWGELIAPRLVASLMQAVLIW